MIWLLSMKQPKPLTAVSNTTQHNVIIKLIKQRKEHIIKLVPVGFCWMDDKLSRGPHFKDLYEENI